jgi:hypothetical protein
VRPRKKIKLGLEWLYYRPAKLIKREFRALAPLLQLHTQSAQKAAVITLRANGGVGHFYADRNDPGGRPKPN